jgi:phosphopantetheine adenylyltransferase
LKCYFSRNSLAVQVSRTNEINIESKRNFSDYSTDFPINPINQPTMHHPQTLFILNNKKTFCKSA